MSTDIDAFSKQGSNVVVPATGAATVLSTSVDSHNVRVVNTTAVVGYIEFGDSTVVAAGTTGNPVLPGTERIFAFDGLTHAAAVGAALDCSVGRGV